jgi:hypothetical protein
VAVNEDLYALVLILGPAGRPDAKRPARPLQAANYLRSGRAVETQIAMLSVAETQRILEFQRTVCGGETIFQVDVDRASDDLKQSTGK